MIKKDEKKISSSFEENIAYMDQVLPVKESFDIIKREMEIGGRKSFFYFIKSYNSCKGMCRSNMHTRKLHLGGRRWILELLCLY